MNETFKNGVMCAMMLSSPLWLSGQTALAEESGGQTSGEVEFDVKSMEGVWDLSEFICLKGGLTFYANIGNSKLENGQLKGVLSVENGATSFELHGEFRIFLKFSCQYSGTFQLVSSGPGIAATNVKGEDTSPSCPLPIFPFLDGDRFDTNLVADTIFLTIRHDIAKSAPSVERIANLNDAYCGSGDGGQLQYRFSRRLNK